MTLKDSPRLILKTLKSAKRILIPLHTRPDGDSIGSSLACYHLLKDLGKNPLVVSADEVPGIFFFLPGARRIKIIDPADLDLSRFDLLLLVDNADLGRFNHRKDFTRPPQLLTTNLDHHISNKGYGDLNYVVPEASASSEVLHELFRLWKVKITPAIADCLLTGIYNDTGGFIYTATTAASLSRAADLIRRGADRDAVVENSFRSWPSKTRMIWATILSNAQTRNGVTYSVLSHRDILKLKTPLADLHASRSFAVNNFLLAIGNVRIAAMFTEEKPRLIRVSLRSKAGENVEEIARKMGGGGHRYAASFDYHGPLKEAVRKTLKILR